MSTLNNCGAHPNILMQSPLSTEHFYKKSHDQSAFDEVTKAKGMLDMIKMKQQNYMPSGYGGLAETQRESMIKAIQQIKDANEEDELEGRSVSHEFDYSDQKRASLQIKNANLKSLMDSKQRNLQNSFNKSMKSGNDKLSQRSFGSKAASIHALSHRSGASKRSNRYGNSDLKSQRSAIVKPAVKNEQERAQTIERLMGVLGSVKQQDVDLLDKFIELLWNDKIMQQALNDYRSSKNSAPVINFESVEKAADLKDQKYGITLDELLDAMNHIKIDDAADQQDQEYKDYVLHKQIAMNQGYDEQEGVNALVYEECHDPLQDLQTQQKRKFFPTMAESSQEFDQLLFPASQYQRSEREKMIKLIESKNKKRDGPNAGSYNGSWTTEKPDLAALGPAGMRIPKNFKRGLGDKIPELIERLKAEGKEESEILEQVNAEKQKQIAKYGNKSKIGLILESENAKILKNMKIMNNDNYLRKMKIRNTSEFNRALIQQNEVGKMRNSFRNIALSLDGKDNALGSRRGMSVSESPWNTTNQMVHSPQEIGDMQVYRKNFKKRTPFTQWSNAYFGNGVFFNPPVGGI